MQLPEQQLAGNAGKGVGNEQEVLQVFSRKVRRDLPPKLRRESWLAIDVASELRINHRSELAVAMVRRCARAYLSRR